MNFYLARSVVDAIARPSVEHAVALRRFREHDWWSSYHWLVTSGLALHLLAALKECQAEAVLPPAVRKQLCALDRASSIRTRDLRRDFLELNNRFEAAGAAYANWKGFALEPDFCADVRFRPQMDFDFIVQPNDAELFDSVLRDCGYVRTQNTAIEATYEIMPCRPYSMEQVYQSKPQRKIELHFAADHGSFVTSAMDLRGALERRQTATVDGQAIPVLSPEDAFLSHAAHAGRHALEGWVRLGWLHEIDRFARCHAGDTEMWRNIASVAEKSSAAVTAAAVGILLTGRIWGRELSSSLAWASDVLPSAALQWIHSHGEKLAIADFPGTKLNLLLQRELVGSADWSKLERAALCRPRAIPRVAFVSSNATLFERLSAGRVQFAFLSRRIVFHCVETMRYLFLKWRWNRCSRAQGGSACNVPVTADSNRWDG